MKEELSTIMRNNKVIKFAAIALLSAFALTACNDDIIAKPTGYGDNSPVVTIKDGNGNEVKVYNNNFDDIYDGIRSGSLASDVLDTLLYQYSMSVFGNYNKVTAATVTSNPYGEITLKQAVAGLTQTGGVYSGTQATKDFIKAHSAYWNKDKNGKRVKDDFKTELAEDADPEQAEYARLESKWNTIEKRIAQKLYSEISGGTYSEENVFYELKFLRSLSSSIENNVITISDAVKTQAFKGVLTAKVEDYDLFDETKGKTEDLDGNLNFILHREFYQSNSGLTQEEAVDQDATYVEMHVIPDIYRQLLVEQYLLDESYDTLGRTSARHISVLSISKNSNYATTAYDLMKTFVNNTIFDKDRTADVDLDTLKIASNAWIGAFMSKAGYNTTDEYKLLEAALPATFLVAGTNPYFKGTAYGDMMEEFEKINDNPKISENESTYTGGNTYTVEVGKTIKTRELETKDYTSTGWYIKSVGVSTLPESLKNQLFDINVANALDGKPCVEYTYDTTANEWKTNEDQANLINVVGKVGKQYFLRNTSRVKDVPVQSDILFESDGTYYVVLVEDAIRSINLSKSSYVDADANKLEKLEGYINEIVQIVSNNDTYKNLSKKHWLEEMNLKYHDSKIYDYFKENFPDLFD